MASVIVTCEYFLSNPQERFYFVTKYQENGKTRCSCMEVAQNVKLTEDGYLVWGTKMGDYKIKYVPSMLIDRIQEHSSIYDTTVQTIDKSWSKDWFS